MRATGPNGWGSGQGSLGGNVGPNGGSASGGGSAQPGPLPKPPTIPDPPKPPSVPNPASDDYGACTAFLAGQKAGGRVPGGVTGPSPKDSSAAFADLIAKHGGTVQSTTVYCDGVVPSVGLDSRETPPIGGGLRDSNPPALVRAADLRSAPSLGQHYATLAAWMQVAPDEVLPGRPAPVAGC
jgi:hypothetical protein